MAGYPPPPQPSPPGPPGPGYGAPWQAQGHGGPPPKTGIPVWLIVMLVAIPALVFFMGIFSALAIYGVRKYIASAKTAEAHASLMAISSDAVSAYERGTTNARGEVVHKLCGSASATVPASIASVKGRKYLSSADEWQVDRARNTGFACLGFSMQMPQYFLYRYHAHGSTRPDDGFEAQADGDLAGDGNLTTFRTTGKISATHTLDVTTEPPR